MLEPCPAEAIEGQSNESRPATAAARGYLRRFRRPPDGEPADAVQQVAPAAVARRLDERGADTRATFTVARVCILTYTSTPGCRTARSAAAARFPVRRRSSRRPRRTTRAPPCAAPPGGGGEQGPGGARDRLDLVSRSIARSWVRRITSTRSRTAWSSDLPRRLLEQPLVAELPHRGGRTPATRCSARRPTRREAVHVLLPLPVGFALALDEPGAR